VQGTIRRVEVAGGPAAVVATTGNPSPGLSPDGTRLVFGDTAGSRQFVVADTNGRRLDTFTLAPPQTPHGWSGNSTLLILTSGTVGRLRTVSVPEGRSRTLFESNDFMLAPAWSPDGKMAAIVRRNADAFEVRIMATDGTLQKTIPLPGFAYSLVWMPDQQRLAYSQPLPPDGRPALTGVEIATGQSRQLREATGDMNWIRDMDVVITSEISSKPGEQRASFWQIDIDGKTTLLRDLPLEPSGSFVAPLDRMSAIVMNPVRHDIRLIRFDGGAEQVVSPEQNGYIVPGPAISADRRWVAFRINSSGNDATRLNRIELVRLDGMARRTIDLPFFVRSQDTLVILPGAEKLIVAERPSPGAVPGVYMINVITRSVVRLFDYLPQGRLPEFAVSPDGQNVLAVISESLSPSVSAIQFAGK
jgi:Tol biopolymer transport system component